MHVSGNWNSKISEIKKKFFFTLVYSSDVTIVADIQLTIAWNAAMLLIDSLFNNRKLLTLAKTILKELIANKHTHNGKKIHGIG
jgi:hypothetical protein